MGRSSLFQNSQVNPLGIESSAQFVNIALRILLAPPFPSREKVAKEFALIFLLLFYQEKK
jgi:hypothetical protein